jgi:hypothetical protein
MVREWQRDLFYQRITRRRRAGAQPDRGVRHGCGIGLVLGGVLQSRLDILQTGPPSQMLGRAYSLYSLIAYGANCLGLVLFGVTGATAFPLDGIFAYSGCSTAAIGASGFATWLAASAVASSSGPSSRI